MKWSEMTPRERDALVSHRVMGIGVALGEMFQYAVLPSNYTKCPQHYSTDIAAAWDVFEKGQQQCDFGMVIFGAIGYTCQFVTMTPDGQYETHEVCASADTAPEAICKAALKAVGVDIE